ncbi:MAG: helix-turn-helix domain-containing protein [Firmicutes bacterium]|nr:helix-turn-helix domain-containing protein [Bacillota bacterium]
MHQIAGKVLEFLKSNGVSDAEICRILGAKKDKVNNWRIGRSKPTVEEIIILAEHFAVPLDELVGRDKKTQDKKERQLLNSFMAAPPAVQKAVLKALRPDSEPEEQ